MNIVFITEFNIECLSGASFIRISELAKAFAKEGHIVYLTSLNSNNYELVKTANIHSSHLNIVGKGNFTRKNYFIDKYFNLSFRYAQLKQIVKYFDSKDTIFIVYNFFSTYFEERKYNRYLKRKGFRIIAEKNELSFGIALNQKASKNIRFFPSLIIKMLNIANGFLTDRLIKSYDGVIAISKYFEENARKHKVPVIRIPILYPKFSTNIIVSKKSPFKIGYFGTLSPKRDLIMELIRAIEILILRKEKVELSITGNASSQNIKIIQSTIKKRNLENNVFFHGYLPMEQLTELQIKQDLLVVLRSKTLQGRATFATKLANYMHLGKIVLASDIGDNSLFINDHIDGFLIDGSEPHIIAEKILEIKNLSLEKQKTIANKAYGGRLILKVL